MIKSQNQSDNDSQRLFCLTNLQAHFKNTQDTSDSNLQFESFKEKQRKMDIQRNSSRC